ncbi:MAG: helix-turn-helix domain-containing protein [Prevotella sp.]|nr:helix-turn-helix domain-containing protein [Prevotella sp.]
MVCLVASLTAGYAQVVPVVITQHYTTAEGLPSNNVMCILKDHDGFMWFGTWYGLCRFDGEKFMTFNKPMKSGSDIPPRKIESMLEDGQGRLWLKTVDWKLYTFDRQTECFHAINDELKKLTHNLQVIKIQRTEEGRILLLTKDKTLLMAYSDSKGIHLTKLFEPQGQIDPQTLQLKEDIVTESQGYHIYIGRDFRIFVVPKKKVQSLQMAMEKEEAGRQQLTGHMEQLAKQAGIAKHTQLYLDKDSLLWVTTSSDGVYCLNMPRQQFDLITLPDNDQTGVRCLYQTRQGNIIVGTRSRNVYIYGTDGKLRQTLSYEQYGIGAIYHAMEDGQGRLWLSTKGDGLVVAVPDASQPIGYRMTHYRHQTDDPASLSGNNVYMTFCDSHQHIWVCTLDGGLNLVNEQKGQLSFYNKQHGLKHYPAYGLYTEVRNMVEDKEGHLWIGTIDGLMSIDGDFKRPEQIQFKTYRDQPEASFANNDIYTLYRDQTGQIWIGAFGGGLQKLGAGPLGPREGLRNDVIFSIVEDLQGHLWFATEAGLSCYNQQTGRIRNFDQYDGIPNVKIEEASALCSSDGHLWIGCKQGILTFSPQQLQTSKSDYRTFIIDVMADGQPYIGSTAMPYTDYVEYAHAQNSFSIEFAALNFPNLTSISYRYRLEGYDRDWRYSGPHRIASYNEVPPGSYTFIVETLDDVNPVLQSKAQLAIRILPPWWATWWAYLIYIVIAALIAWLVIRTVLQMNRMRNEIYISQRLAKLTSKPDESDEFIDKLHRIIRKNIPNTEFNVDAIASEMGLSRSAFYKKVKGLTGFAPIDLIKEFRLSHATELLQTTNLSIAEIAFRSGFADSSYFGKCFRKRYGMSPREYLQQES